MSAAATYIQRRIESYTERYFAAHPEVKLVVVAGSVGKTSTKMALATVLGGSLRIRVQEGNHNAPISAPLAMLGIAFPRSIYNVFAWISVFHQARQRIKQPADVDVAIQELGVDSPGDMAAFGRYLHPHIAVVTAVTPEHMEFFKTIDAVAKEELSVATFSDYTIVNSDDIAKKYILPEYATYSFSEKATYRGRERSFSVEKGFTAEIKSQKKTYNVDAHVLGRHSLKPIIAAVAVADHLGLTIEQIEGGVRNIRAVSGRMNVLKGVNDSYIIDDSYNSSPAAARAALNTLYELDASQRIAVLGSMNELGATSKREHQTLGALCDPAKLDLLVTVGDEANTHVAASAEKAGCKVKRCKDAKAAGEFVKQRLEPGAIVLAKGSQGGIYLEEAVKVLLANKADQSKLVRQSEAWLKRKGA